VLFNTTSETVRAQLISWIDIRENGVNSGPATAARGAKPWTGLMSATCGYEGP